MLLIIALVTIVLVSFYSKAGTDVIGPDIHAKTIGKIHLVQFDSEGVFGWIPTQRELINQFLSGQVTRQLLSIIFF